MKIEVQIGKSYFSKTCISKTEVFDKITLLIHVNDRGKR